MAPEYGICRRIGGQDRSEVLDGSRVVRTWVRTGDSLAGCVNVVARQQRTSLASPRRRGRLVSLQSDFGCQMTPADRARYEQIACGDSAGAVAPPESARQFR